MKSLIQFSLVIALLLSSSPLQAKSGPDTPFYDGAVVCGEKVEGAAGQGPLLGPFFPKVSDIGDMQAKIKSYIQKSFPNSPLLENTENLVLLGEKYNVNPAMAVAFAQKETGMGTAGFGPAPQNNIFNIRNGAAGSFGSYTSVKDSIEKYYQLISGELYLGKPSNFTTVKQILNRYAPPVENKTSDYIQFVNSTMQKILGGSQTTVQAETAGSQSLRGIARDNDVHSVVVQYLGQDVLEAYNEGDPPNTPASMLKLIIVDAVLNTSGVNLDDEITATSAVLYGGANGDRLAVGDVVTVRDAITAALARSSNGHANMLIRQAGGFAAITAMAHSLGYTNTDINRYFKDAPSGPANVTTASNIARAMHKLYTNDRAGYEVAQAALRDSTQTWGLNSEANKWGLASGASTGNPVTANSGVFPTPAGKVVITVYINKADAGPQIKKTTEDILNYLKKKLAVDAESAIDCVDGEESAGAGGTAGAFGYDLTGPNKMVNFDQTDPRWASKPYGTGKSSIGASGCGITSLAMIVRTLKGGTETPLTLANKYGDEYHTFGTAWSLFPVFAEDYNLTMRDIGLNLDEAEKTIRNGGLVLISVDPGYFTGAGHFMVLRKVSESGDSFYLADPNGKGIHGDSETRAFSRSFLQGQGALKHLWAFEK
ncbi:MAG TPA: serine hydrolase [Candidatus Saccharimonadia bacterium]